MNHRTSILTLLLFSLLAVPSFGMLAASLDDGFSKADAPVRTLTYEECEDVEEDNEVDSCSLKLFSAFYLDIKVSPSDCLELDDVFQLLLIDLNAPADRRRSTSSILVRSFLAGDASPISHVV